jgi:hypothetical protein
MNDGVDTTVQVRDSAIAPPPVPTEPPRRRVEAGLNLKPSGRLSPSTSLE